MLYYLNPKEIIFACLNENKTKKMKINVLKEKCVKADFMMEYEFSYEMIHLLASGELELDLNRKICVPIK